MNDFLENSEPRFVASMLVIIIVLVAAIQVLYLLWPQLKEYQQLNNSYQLLDQASKSSDGLEQQLNSTQKEIDTLSYQLHGDMAGLPETQMESYIIGRLQTISWNSDVELASVVPGKGKQVQMFQETLFNVKINASYFNFFNWLQSINNELGYIVVKKFDIQPQGDQSVDNPKLAISLTLVSYRIINNG